MQSGEVMIMVNMLLICHDIPSKTVGATLPIYHLIKHLGRKYDITLVSFDSKKFSLDEIIENIKSVHTMDIPEYFDLTSQLKYTVKNMISFDNLRTRSLLNYYYHPEMNKLIQEVAKKDIDMIVTDMPMAFYAKNIDIPKIVYAFDAVSDYNHNMYLKSKNMTSKIYWYLNYMKIHRYEQIYNRFNCCVLVNEKDKALLEKDIRIPISVVPNGVDTDYFKNNEKDDDVKLVFLGDMSTPPNNDAVKYFIEEIYPKILKEKHIPLFIVGRNPSEYVKSLDENRNITVTGPVDDVRSYLARGSIFITPMISGTGIKNKILEAMSMQLPVVSTSIGISGICAEDNVNFMLADDEEAFKGKIIQLAMDNDLREDIGNNARSFVKRNYSWEKSMKEMEEILEKLP